MAVSPDPALLAQIDAILATAPEGFAEWRRSQLEDDQWQWWRDANPDYVAGYWDPDELRAQAAHMRDMLDPYSATTIKLREFLAAAERGGQLVMSEMGTGRVVMRRQLPSSPEGAAPTN